MLPRPWLLALRRVKNPVAWLHTAPIYRAAFMCTVSASLLTLALYWGKARAALIDSEIAQAIQATQRARSQTYGLRAEWASLNDPSLLRVQAARYLNLHRIDPGQFAALDQLSARLDHPPAVAAGPDDVPTLGPEPDPIRVAAANPPPPAASHMASKPKPELPHWLTEAHLRQLSEPPHVLALQPQTVLALAPPKPHRYSVIAGQLPPLRPAIVAAAPHFATAAPYQPRIASALGNQAALPPPQPMDP